MRELLKGLVDMHVHGSPSIAPRVETWDFLREMNEAGYKAICLKEHFIPTTGIAYTINNSRPSLKTQVIGSVVLNNALGGLNVSALDCAALLGARQVFLPTVSAKNHCDFLKTVKSFGGGGLSVPEKPIYMFRDDYGLTDEICSVIDYLAKHPELTLSMGHISAQEISVLLPYALEAGVEKVVIDHPYFILGASIDDVSRWSKLGAYINFTCSSLEGIGKNGHVPLETLERTLAEVPEDRLVISTDFGQPYNGSPVEGMYRMIEILINDLKVPERRVMDMTHALPSKLLGLN